MKVFKSGSLTVTKKKKKEIREVGGNPRACRPRALNWAAILGRLTLRRSRPSFSDKLIVLENAKLSVTTEFPHSGVTLRNYN